MKAGRLTLFLLALSTTAWASSPDQLRFDQASAAMADGRIEQAIHLFQTLADELPNSPSAPDALFIAATLYEERLLKPAPAAVLYRKLSERYPDSRVARAAEKRLRQIDKLLSPGTARALERLQALRTRPDRSSDAAMEEARKLAADYPEWKGVGEVLLWLAGAHDARGELEEALATYDRAAAASDDPELRFDANRRGGELALSTGHFEAAKARFAQLKAETAAQLESQKEAWSTLKSAKRRRSLLFLAQGSLLIAGLFLLVSLVLRVRARTVSLRSSLAVPDEALYMLPLVAFLLLVSFTGFREIAPAVAIVGLGSSALVYLSGCALNLRASTRSIALHLVAVLAGVISLIYIALHRSGLLDQMWRTLRFGPDL